MSNSRYNLQSQDILNQDVRLLYISTSRYEGDWNSIPHTHYFAELFYVVKGKGTVLLDGQSSPIGVNDLILVAPETEHTEQSLNAEPLEYMVMGVEGITFSSKDAPGGRIIHHYQEQTDILNILKLMRKELREEKEGYESACRHLLNTLLILISREQALYSVPVTAARMTKECGKIKRYLDERYAEPVSLDSLAAITHMNRYYMVHAFTKFTGLSPIHYLNTRRLMEARTLLLSTNYSIAQIAASTGFSSQSYFSQAFKKDSGLTPNAYRQQKHR